MTPGLIGSNIIRQKSANTTVSRIAKNSVKTRKKQHKLRKRRQNFEGGVSSEEDNSEDIEYDDSDNNANVAGADEADSVGEADDTVGELQGLQEPHQVMIHYI